MELSNGDLCPSQDSFLYIEADSRIQNFTVYEIIKHEHINNNYDVIKVHAVILHLNNYN